MALKKYFIAGFALALVASSVFAAVPEWKIVPAESHLTFKGTQNGAPANGEFTKFNGTIKFDPEHVDEGEVNIVVDIASLKTDYGDMTTALNSADWFDTEVFPQAVFKANKFKKTGDKTYEAEGTLTIRGKSIPTHLTFEQLENANNKAKVKGEVMLKRTAFGVGRGDWSDTETVKDDVKVEFIITATKV